MNLKKICEEYYPIVHGYLLTITNGNKDLAEDLTQETFFRAIKNIKTFKGKAKVLTWLCQIAKYTFWQYLDKKNRHREVTLEDFLELPTAELVEDAYLKTETNNELLECMEKLDANTRAVVLYRINGELSFREIGELMDQSENWARVTFYRGKQKLGKEIRDHEQI